MTASKNVYATLKSMEFGIIMLYISVIFVNPDNGNIEDETYLNTATKISEKEKEKYSLVSKVESIMTPFYTI